MPKVSVNMPCYNCEKYVGLAIESILKQTYHDFEFIIVNDGSTDRSLEVIKSYDDPRIIIINNEINSGIVITRNIALSRSSGEYIAILDSDDIACPDRLAEQVAFLDENPDYGIIGSWIDIIDEDGLSTGEVRKTPESREIIPILSLFQNCFAQSSVMLRKSDLPNVWYRPEIPFSEDFDLWLRVIENSKVTNIPKTLVHYRVHSENISKNHDLMLSGLHTIIRYQLASLGIVPTASELELHANFFGIGDIKNDNLEEVESWLLKINEANNKINRFDIEKLGSVVGNMWLLTLQRHSLFDVIKNMLSSESNIYSLANYGYSHKSLLVLSRIYGSAINVLNKMKC